MEDIVDVFKESNIYANSVACSISQAGCRRRSCRRTHSSLENHSPTTLPRRYRTPLTFHGDDARKTQRMRTRTRAVIARARMFPAYVYALGVWDEDSITAVAWISFNSISGRRRVWRCDGGGRCDATLWKEWCPFVRCVYFSYWVLRKSTGCQHAMVLLLRYCCVKYSCNLIACTILGQRDESWAPMVMIITL